ncbi:MAG: hypothetical protein ABIK12_09475, partial [Pseudomonadota bacterium]
PLQGKKGVCSLNALLLDMQQHLPHVTRFDMITSYGLDYSEEKRKKAREVFVKEQIKQGQKSWWVPPECDYDEILLWHVRYDRLCNKDANTRKPEDNICMEIITNLISKLEKGTLLINNYVNKFIAHRASQDSRGYINADELKITYKHLTDAHKTLTEVATFLSSEIFGSGIGAVLPLTAIDKFRYLDVPLLTKENIDALEKVWGDFQKFCDELAYYSMDQYEAEFGKITA